MLAVFTSSASTFVFQALYVSEVVEGFDLGANNNTSVAIRPTSHNVCNQRGAGLRGGGFGGSFGGPDFTELER